MGLLDTEILSNRWDVENSLNNAMNERAMGWGQLDRTAYAPMTASTALQGDMQGQSIGGMLGGQQVEMQKQDIIDNIMANNPDPRTSEELRTVAKQFAEAGLTDYSFQITEVANQLYKTEIEKDTATDKWYTGISKTLGNNLLTRPVVEMYAQELYGISPEDWADEEKYTPTVIKSMLADAKSELQGQIDNYANRKRMDNVSKTDIRKLMGNDSDFVQDFYADLTQYGNTDVVNFLQSVTKFDTTDGKNTMKVNAEFRSEIRPNDLEEMDGAAIIAGISKLKAIMKTRTLTAIEKKNFELLQGALNSLDKGGENEVDITYERIKDEERFKGMDEEDIKEMIRRSLGITSSIPSASNGTMLAMNTQQPEDNYSSWVLG